MAAFGALIMVISDKCELKLKKPAKNLSFWIGWRGLLLPQGKQSRRGADLALVCKVPIAEKSMALGGIMPRFYLCFVQELRYSRVAQLGGTLVVGATRLVTRFGGFRQIVMSAR